MTDWYLAPSLAKLRSQVDATFPDRSKASDGTLGDAAHAATNSDHNPDPKTGVVRALDLTVDTAQGQKVLAATWQDPRVFYVIWRKQIYYRGESKPRPYNGVNAHLNHIHISIDRNKESAETDTSNWKGLDMARMVSPILGYVSSEFGNRSGFFHGGIDIATGGNVRPVYAAYAGTLSNIVRGRKHKQPATQGPVVAPGRSGNGARVNNPDGETQAYIHVTLDAKWKDGDRVERGERLGVIDLSGNTTGYHLHFEIWGKGGQLRDPRLDFKFHGVTPGSAPDVYVPPAPKPKPKPTPAPSKKRKGPSGQTGARTAQIQKNLANMGYDVGPPDEDYGNRTTNAVKAYQNDLNTYAGAGLFVDGDWGPVMDGWFSWVKQLQRVLPAWQGVPKLRVDGAYQRLTANAVKILQRRNGLHPDGKAQIKTTTFMRRHGSNISNPPKNRP